MTLGTVRPSPVEIRRFSQRFAGDVILPGDAQYDDARRLWNAMFDRRPFVIARPTTTDAVAAAIRFAREWDLAIAVRGGGHSAGGHSSFDGGLVIDLSGMRGVTLDVGGQVARVAGGALLRELDRAAQAHGLVCPVGVVGHTGVGGLTLGGGMGRLQRRWGLTIDNVRAVELVTAEGELVRTSATEEPGLFWGVRGAGPNFGVVTAFELGLHPFNGTLMRGLRMYDARVIHEVWPIARDFAATAPDTVSLTYGIARAEPAAEYPDAIGGRVVFFVSFNHCGDPSDVEADTAPLRAGPEPALSTVTRTRYLDIQAANDQPMGWGHRSYIRGAFADDLRPGTLDALVAHVSTAAGEASFGVTAMGGAVSRVPGEATAFTGRGARLEISADVSWEDPAEDEVQVAWVRRAMDIVEPDCVPGRYVNEIPESSEADSRAIYGDATYERLAALKRTWDPQNVFRLNHNILPAD